VQEKLYEHGVVVDFREPNAIRAAPAPLYNTFAECLRFVATLRKVLDERQLQTHDGDV
jgi:kynureninase